MIREIYFAGGCFWGIEEFFLRISGVIDTRAGYANSLIENPSYRDVCAGFTDASECVKVIYEDELISLKFLLEKFFSVIDPTSLNRQGADIGTQYRSGIYYTDDKDGAFIKSYIGQISSSYEEKIVTEVLKIKNFYEAEDYHQRYLRKNPSGYCHIKL
ncbi:peptide-methionine (S)-S-oxide reductase MsrA [Peptoniphilus sp. GNH]|nr:peptide-methionine (S)-S-oxide reductase [Clostridiales bacterium KA00134]UHR03004.1 peptide-methionine (S)-S-oxide reductase MsrA [Peptoniphilus sp. GNH]